MHAHWQTFARYNMWANRRLYDACAALPRDAYHAARPAFFGSIHGTLNHILVGDRVWMARLEGISSDNDRLDAVPFDELTALRDARVAQDGAIQQFVDGLGEEALARDLHYSNMAGEAQVTPVSQVLAHMFNHETHHRGQVHDMLSQTDVAPPPLDLIYYLREPS